MPPRRAELELSINIDSITGLPATPPGGGGGGGGGAGPGGSGDTSDVGSMAANVLGVGGLFAARRSLLSLVNLIKGLPPEVAVIVVAALATVGAGVLLMIHGIRTLWKIAQGLQGAFVALGKAGWNAAVMLMRGYLQVGKTVLTYTVKAIQWLGQQTVEWAKRGAEALKDMVVRATEAYAELQQSAANTATVVGKFGAAALVVRAQVEEFAMGMASSMRYSAKEVADAMYQVYSYGYTARQEVEALTAAALNLASATLYGVEATTEFMASILAAFNIPATKAAEVADILFNAVRDSAAEMPKLVAAMRYAAPTAAQFGISLKETVAVLEGFYRVGLQGSQAGTYFRQMIVSLSRAVPNAQKAFKQFGADLKEFSVISTGSVLVSLQKLQALRDRIGAKNFNQMILNAFGTRGSFGILASMAAGVGQINTYLKNLDQSGTAAKAAADQLNTLAGAWQLLKNNMQNFEMLVIRGQVATWFMAFVRVLRDLISYARQSGAIQALQGVIVNLVAGVGVLLRLLGPTAIYSIRNVLISLGAAIWQVFRGIVPLIPVLTGFLQWIPKLFSYAFAEIIPMVIRFGQTFIPLLIRVAGVVLPFLVAALTGVGNFLTMFLRDNGDAIVLWFRAFTAGVLQVIAYLPQLLPLLRDIVVDFVMLAPEIIDAAVNGIPALIAAAQELLPWLIAVAYRGVGVLLLAMEYLRTHLSSHLLPIIERFLGTLIMVFTFIINKWPQIVNVLNLAAWTIYTVFTTMQGTIGGALSAMGKWIDYLDNHGKQVILTMIDLVRNLVALMGAKVMLDAIGALIALELAYPAAAIAGHGKEIALAMDLLKEMITNVIPNAIRGAGSALRGIRGEAEKIPGPNTGSAGIGPGAYMPPPATTTVAFNLTPELTVAMDMHWNGRTRQYDIARRTGAIPTRNYGTA